MALSKIQPASIDLTANYAFTGTNSVAGIDYAEKKLATLTASSSSTLSFTSNIDSTYNIYKFRFVNMHPATNSAHFSFQCSTDGGSNYNTTITSTYFSAYHAEGDSAAGITYVTGDDQAQGTSFQKLADQVKNDNDTCISGMMTLFNPSSTTFVKHWMGVCSNANSADVATRLTSAGYFNTTSAINAVQFKFSSGNIDSGTIEMYGIN